MLNDFITDQFKEIIKLQDIKTYELYCKSGCRKTFNFNKYSLPVAFKEIYMKDIYH